MGTRLEIFRTAGARNEHTRVSFDVTRVLAPHVEEAGQSPKPCPIIPATFAIEPPPQICNLDIGGCHFPDIQILRARRSCDSSSAT